MSTVLAMLIAAASGVLLGTVTGLIPGLHVNTIGFLLLAATATVAQPPVVIAAAILAAGITHTYLSIVPGLVLGVPEAATVVGALPGHRMVLQGAGPEAIRLSAIGSGVALVVAAALALPLAQLIGEHHTLFRRAVPALIALIAAILIISEQTTRGRIGGLCCMLLAVGFGQLTLELPTSGGLLPAGMVSILGPIFSGLFGAPILIDALATGGQIPQQRDGSLQISPGAAVRAATSGALGGAMVGFLPGVSAGVASIIALGGVGGSTTPGAETDRRYIIATSGADTSTAVFALASLVVIGSPRSGITIALEQLGGGAAPASVLTLLLLCVLAAGCALLVLLWVGEWYLEQVRRLPRRPIITGVLLFLLGLAGVFAGVVGIGVFVAAAVLGLLPPRLHTRRVHLMGVLFGPVVMMGL
jgi:putative membrane protein